MSKFETKRNLRLQLTVSLLMSLLIVAPEWASALPKGGNIAQGTGSIQHSSKQDMVVQQNSQRLVTNWKSFSIGSAESVTFKQPNSSSVALNRVVGSDPSILLGKLSANGQVFLTNPSGVLFGKNAVVDVHGLLATTLNITDQDFMEGNYEFSQSPYRFLSGIVNDGVINATSYVGLAAPFVVNRGSIIVADLGSVALAAGTTATLDFNGDGLISFAVDDNLKDQIYNRRLVGGQVHNSGLIRANGGQVLLTTGSAGRVIGSVVNHTGIIEAQAVQSRDGKIILSGGDRSDIHISGVLDSPEVLVKADEVTVGARKFFWTDYYDYEGETDGEIDYKSKSLSTNNGDIHIVANDLDFRGDLNSGTGDVSFTLANGGDINLTPGNSSRGLAGKDLGHIIAENLILQTKGDINVKGITEKNTGGIKNSVVLKSGKDITFEKVASVFPSLELSAANDINVNVDVTSQKDFTAVADSDNNGKGDFNVAKGKLVSTKDGDIDITANDLNLKGKLNSGMRNVLFTRANGGDLNLAPGNPYRSLGSDDLRNITAENLILKTEGDINVNGIAEEDTAGITDSVILKSGKNITFEGVASAFSALKLFAITDINVNVDVTTTNPEGDFIAVADSENNGIGDFNVARGVTITSARDIDVNAAKINAKGGSFNETRNLVLNNRVVTDPEPSLDTNSIQQGSLGAFLTEFFENGGSGGC